MGLFLLAQRTWGLLPPEVRDLKWLFVMLVFFIGQLYVDSTESQYIIISQRMTLAMSIVTPKEIDMMEELCVVGFTPIKSLIYDKKAICTPEMKEFFYERVATKNPR